MPRATRIALAVLLVTLAVKAEPARSTAPSEVMDRLGPPAPSITRLDAIDLSRLARRSVAARLSGKDDGEPLFVPDTLRSVECRISLSLRDAGRLVAAADSESLPITEAVRRAAADLVEPEEVRSSLQGRNPDAMSLELELIGPLERVGLGVELPERLAPAYEPAIHGIGVRFHGEDVLVRPSQLISRETFCEQPDGAAGHRCDRYFIAIRNFQEKFGIAGARPTRPPESVAFLRFRTAHWFQPRADAEPVLLVGGLRRVDPAAVTVPTLCAVVEDLGRYLRHRQSDDGIFSYEFLPGRSLYWPRDQNWVRQAATTWALAVFACKTSDEAAARATDRAIEALSDMLRPLEGDKRAQFLYTPDSLHPLGATALLALAMMDSPHSPRHADALAQLMAAIETMQWEDGSFRTAFPPSNKTSSQDYYPGEALLAIAKYYARTRDGRWRAMFERALPFYTRYFRETRTPAFIPWQAQAWGHLARTTQLRRYADFVFEMTDLLITLQVDPGSSPLSIYDGAIDTSGTGRGGISTAVYLEGIADAALTAEAFGEQGRAERYRAATRHAARFVLQLRFKEEEAFYVQSPRDVVGAMRNSPIDPTLRIDHVQHGLASLLSAAEVLKD